MQDSRDLLPRFLLVIGLFTIVAALACVVAYWWWFDGHLGRPLADDSIVWGQFGDYVGGVAGTLLVGATLAALVISIRIQQRMYDAAKHEFETTARLLSVQTENARLQSVLGEFRFTQQVLRDHLLTPGHEHSLRDVWRVFAVQGQVTWDLGQQVVAQDFRNREEFLSPLVKLACVLFDVAENEQSAQRDRMLRALAASLNDDAIRALRILAHFDVPDTRLGRSLNGNPLFRLTDVQERMLQQQFERMANRSA